MGLFGFSKKENANNNDQHRDERKAECPCCQKPLSKIPDRKTKCPHCSEFMFVRTRPKDNVRVLVTEKEAGEIDEEKALMFGTYGFNADEKEVEKERVALRKKLGKEPSTFEITWELLSKDLLKNAKENNWGLYRNNILQMGESLQREMRFGEAIKMYLEVCYLDLNGPNNMGGMTDPEIMREFPPFDPKRFSFLAPGVIGIVCALRDKLNIDKASLKKLFIEVNSIVEKKMKLPLSLEKCWVELEEEIK